LNIFKNPKICLTTKDMLGNCHSWDFQQVKGNKQCSGFTCKWWNKDSSFFNNLCKVALFEVIGPKMESSLATTSASIRLIELGFWR
jgi:hypothetical protein